MGAPTPKPLTHPRPSTTLYDMSRQSSRPGDTVVISVSVPRAMLEALDAHTTHVGITRASLIRLLIKAELDRAHDGRPTHP